MEEPFCLVETEAVKKATDTIKRLRSCEDRITDNTLHVTNRQIVNRAIETNSLIALGRVNLRSWRHGKKIKTGFQHSKMIHQITYKAALAGIKVLRISERWTSQICRKCNHKGIRNGEGWYKLTRIV
jgi:IS605 OrfB family transposase